MKFLCPLFALPSVIIYTYFIAFGFTGTSKDFIFSWIFECVFGLEIILEFFTAYIDKET